MSKYPLGFVFPGPLAEAAGPSLGRAAWSRIQPGARGAASMLTGIPGLPEMTGRNWASSWCVPANRALPPAPH